MGGLGHVGMKGGGGRERKHLSFFFSFSEVVGGKSKYGKRCEKRFDCHHLSAYTHCTHRKCTVAFLRPSKCSKCPSTPALGPSPSGEKQTSRVERAAGGGGRTTYEGTASRQTDRRYIMARRKYIGVHVCEERRPA